MPIPQHLRRSAVLVLAASLLAAAAPEAPAPSPPPRPNRYQTSGAFGAFMDGRFAASQGELDIAAAAFLRALEGDPRNVDLIQPAFIATLLAGRPEAPHLARRLPDVPMAQLLIANQEIKAGNWDAAEQRVRAAPRQGGQPAQVLLAAWAQQGAGRTDAALATLRPLLDNARTRTLGALHSALINDLAARHAEAQRLYRIMQADTGGANLRLGQMIASWQVRQGQLAEAGATLRALLENGEDLPLAVSSLLAAAAQRPVARPTDGAAEVYFSLASLVAGQREGSEMAPQLLRLALDLRPDFTQARLLLAEVLEAGKNWTTALIILAPVAADDPLSGVVRLRRATLLDRAGRTDDALRDLDQLARDFPDSPLAYAQAGDILRVKSRFGEAVISYDRAIARMTAPKQGAWSLYYTRGIAQDRSGAWPKAERDFQRALELMPDHPYILNYLGYAWADQGRNLTKARALLERAMERKPNDGAITDSMGWVLFRQGDAPGAIRLLERAAELQPTDPVINLHLGDAYWAAGRKREANFQWQRALLLNPEPDDKVKLEAKLRENGAALDAAPERIVQ